MSDVPPTTRQLRSRVDESGEVRISIETVDTPQPRSHQLLVRVEAAPINPSDLALLLAMSDVTKAEAADAAVTAPIHPAVLKSLKARVGQSLPVGNEGAGVVVAAGDSDEAQALLGKTVAFLGGGAYGEHALTTTQTCMPLPDGVDATQGASSFVNPLTALGFVETMRREGYSAHRPHRRGLQPRPDAQPDLPRRRRPPGQHRPQARAGPAAARPGRHPRRRLQQRRPSSRTSSPR